MRFRILMPLLVAALALGAAACGDDKKSSSSALSKDEFVKQASATCSKYNAEGKAIKAPDNIQDAGQAAPYLDKAAAIVKEAVAKLKTLKPPADLQSDWDAYIAQEEKGVAILEGAAAKAKAKDPSGLKDLDKLTAVGDEAKAIAKKVGATGCAS